MEKFALTLVAINKNDHVKKIRSAGDKLADKVTALAGSSGFLMLNVIWFVVWILMNEGAFGQSMIFDPYPFGFLTMVVSLEAIILSVFVLISQNRQSERAEIRAELDYVTDLQADAEIIAIMTVLERLADKQGVDISDVVKDLHGTQRRLLKGHPYTEKDLED